MFRKKRPCNMNLSNVNVENKTWVCTQVTISNILSEAGPRDFMYVHYLEEIYTRFKTLHSQHILTVKTRVAHLRNFSQIQLKKKGYYIFVKSQ